MVCIIRLRDIRNPSDNGIFAMSSWVVFYGVREIDLTFRRKSKDYITNSFKK